MKLSAAEGPTPLLTHGITLLLIAACLTGCASLDPRPPAAFSLTGHWVLDPLASDAPPRTRGPESEPMPRGRPRGSRPGRRGQGAERGMGGAEMALGQALLAAPGFNAIQDETSLTLSFAGFPDRDIRFGRSEALRGTIEAGWSKQGALEVRSERHGNDNTERFMLSDDGTRLTVETRLEMPQRGPVTLLRVFDRRAAEPVTTGTEDSAWDQPLLINGTHSSARANPPPGP